ncbi:DUF5686 family protein [Seonamhaeicola sp. ML3]|uniref:DUF5686 family protein n=1 Tax=Seonamhaeicola sp. ML3 TaxID=2937786 RepID=UPI00200FB6CC|nr:DUF5686 family protein [Seonamhaeicola sp. ML3]
MKAIRTYRISIFVLLVCIFFMQALQAQNGETPQKRKTNAISVPQILFSGVLFENPEKNQVWYISNAFELFSANTVEGFVFNPQVKFTQNYQDGRFFSLNPNLRYGFGNERFQAQLKTQYFYNPNKNGLLELSGGRAIEQLYDESTLSAFNNTLYTFAFSENFLKAYERSYIEFSQTVSPFKNFLLSTTFSWNERNPLNNLTKYEDDEDFTSNNPENVELANTAFEKNTAVVFEAELRWQIGHRLERKRGQLISKGKYPALTLSYTNANDDILGGDVSYEKLSLSIQDDYEIGYNRGRFFIEVGDFLKKDNLTFVDFNHFKGKETVYGTYGNNQFQLLEYYSNSTADFYIQGHYEHYFESLYTIYDEVKFQPVVGVNYLYTEASGNYVELGVGMDKIFDNWRVDFYNSWRDSKYESFGVRIGFNIN